MAPLSRNKKRIYAIVHTISLHFAPPMLYVQYKHIYMLGNGGNKLFDYDRLRLIISLRTLCPSISKSLAMSVVHIRSLLEKGTYIVNCNIDSERILDANSFAINLSTRKIYMMVFHWKLLKKRTYFIANKMVIILRIFSSEKKLITNDLGIILIKKLCCMAVDNRSSVFLISLIAKKNHDDIIVCFKSVGSHHIQTTP